MKTYKKIMAVGMLASLGFSMMGTAYAATEDMVSIDTSSLVEAIENNDYEAFVSALTDIDSLAAEHMNEDVFERLVEKYNLHEDIDEAVDTLDYAAWSELVLNLPGGELWVETISEEEFESYKNMLDAREDGDIETARSISEDIGLTEMREQRMEAKEALKEARTERRENVVNALEENDYDAWLEAIEGSPAEERMTEIINEDNFSDLIEIHELRVEGDNDAAREAAIELGIPKKHVFKNAWHKLVKLIR